MKALTVANYIIKLEMRKKRPTISNLKLQKILYYCQGFHLAVFREPLFSDPIMVGLRGPVVESVHSQYKDYQSDPIPKIKTISNEEITNDKCKFIESIFIQCVPYAAWQLKSVTYQESPLFKTRQQREISQMLMTQLFQQKVKKVKTPANIRQSFFEGVSLFLNKFAEISSFGLLERKNSLDRVAKAFGSSLFK